jgi:hypothetical protein
MRNCYKREDVFICRHDTHRRFDFHVSAWHVLREKHCYPDGCVSFLWRCKLLDKGGSCLKRYRHVGNNCTQCRYYTEEKIHRRPEVLLPAGEFDAFRAECQSFDEWFEDNGQRLALVGGRVTHVHPHLLRRVDGAHTSLHLRGFFARLDPAYIGMHGFDDALYVRFSRSQQERHGLAAGDEVETEAWVRFDRGRVVAEQVRRIHVDARAGARPVGWNDALLDRSSAVRLSGQPGRCLRCERGLLIDVEQLGTVRGASGGRPRRELLCLAGIGRPEGCPYEGLLKLQEELAPAAGKVSGCNLRIRPA